jgi:hypothetical protein
MLLKIQCHDIKGQFHAVTRNNLAVLKGLVMNWFGPECELVKI